MNPRRAILSLVLVVAVGGAVVVSTRSSDRSASKLSVPAYKGSDAAFVSMPSSSSAVPADVQRAFPVFQRARSSTDVIPAFAEQALQRAQGQSGVDPGQSRLVLGTNTDTIWLVPGDNVVCEVETTLASASSLSVGCSGTTAAETQGLVAVGGTFAAAAGPSSANVTVSGILPQGAGAVTVRHTDGATTVVQKNAEGAFSYSSTSPVKQITLIGADGKTYTLAEPSRSALPGPVCPAASPSCS